MISVGDGGASTPVSRDGWFSIFFDGRPMKKTTVERAEEDDLNEDSQQGTLIVFFVGRLTSGNDGVFDIYGSVRLFCHTSQNSNPGSKSPTFDPSILPYTP
jgi:hypothetical protein